MPIKPFISIRSTDKRSHEDRSSGWEPLVYLLNLLPSTVLTLKVENNKNKNKSLRKMSMDLREKADCKQSSYAYNHDPVKFTRIPWPVLPNTGAASPPNLPVKRLLSLYFIETEVVIFMDRNHLLSFVILKCKLTPVCLEDLWLFSYFVQIRAHKYVTSY